MHDTSIYIAEFNSRVKYWLNWLTCSCIPMLDEGYTILKVYGDEYEPSNADDDHVLDCSSSDDSEKESMFTCEPYFDEDS